MKFCYSICYPDKEEIEYSKLIIGHEEIYKLIENFDWDTELSKKIDFYSPSLEFINIEDRKRIILSGIGDGYLEFFQIMFINPIPNFREEIFNEKNYRGTDSYCKTVAIEESTLILELFTSYRYQEIQDILTLDRSSGYSNNRSLNESIRRKEPKRYFITSRVDFENRSLGERYLFRVAGPFLISFWSMAALITFRLEPFSNIGFMITSGVALMFLIGTILLEIDLRR